MNLEDSNQWGENIIQINTEQEMTSYPSQTLKILGPGKEVNIID